MERRFEERKREIEQDAKIDERVLADSVRCFQQFGAPTSPTSDALKPVKTRQFFLEGFLPDLPQKTLR